MFGDEDYNDDDGVCAALTLCVTPAFPVSDVDMLVGKDHIVVTSDRVINMFSPHVYINMFKH